MIGKDFHNQRERGRLPAMNEIIIGSTVRNVYPTKIDTESRRMIFTIKNQIN